MRQMERRQQKDTEKPRSRQLNTIMETVENEEEKGDHSMDARLASEEAFFRANCNAFRLANLQCCRTPRRVTHHSQATILCAHEKPVAFSHAVRAVTVESPRWREKTSLSVTPVEVSIRTQDDFVAVSRFTPSCTDCTDVQLLFPEFFLGGEDAKEKRECRHQREGEQSDDETASSDDPLVRSWLDLFGQVSSSLQTSINRNG